MSTPDPHLPPSATDGLSAPADPGGATRRDVLRWLAYGSVGVAAAGTTAWGLRHGAPPVAAPSTTVAARPVPPAEKVLVVIELGGGNDGWSTLVPFEQGRYHDLRPTLALEGDRVVDQGNGWALNARLAGLSRRGLAMLAGVGTFAPDLSHFEMFDRWHHGTPDPSESVPAAARRPTGFLGRLCDAVGEPDALTGLSLGWGDHPQMRTERTSTVGLGALGTDTANAAVASARLRTLLDDLTAGSAPAYLDVPRQSLRRMRDVIGLVDALPPATPGYPDTDLGLQMAFASRLVMSGRGVRVVHVPMGAATFDTHAQHAPAHDRLMRELNGAVSAFLDDLRARGVAEKVLVATTSEFGRRPEEHSGGLDHGTASVMMLLGPVVPGLHGEPSPVDRFDDLDNLVATMEFDRYYATLAAWLDVDPARVLGPRPGGRAAAPVDGLLRT